ncbi:MAG TPA: replicative DNA helicase, partial [Dehalococcoidia bacterium]|nr:replicative DNA helicase [Dehalococcoidia bacterium]
AINQITVADELARRGKLEEVGGIAYLSHLVSVLPTSIHVEYYAQIVHRLAMMRRLIAAAGQIAAIGYEAGSDLDATLDKAEDILFKLRRGERPHDFVHIRQVLNQYFEETGLAAPSVEHPSHVLTGFAALDELLGGLQHSDMIILAARPSVGKSSLGLSIARNVAIEQRANVAIFSLEMAKEQLVQRFLSSEAEVDSKRVRLGRYAEAEERRVMEAVGVLSEAPIYIDDSPALKIVEMRSKALRLDYEQGIDLIIVDYLQLIRGGGDGRVENKVQEVSEISRSLKALARELDTPVLAVSQLSRAVEQRPSHIPMLSDLRESGSIEQDADVVMFIHREEVYYTKEVWERSNPDKPYPKGIANIIVAKHRNGPTGQRDLRFRQNITKFENLLISEQEVEQQTLPRFPN